MQFLAYNPLHGVNFLWPLDSSLFTLSTTSPIQAYQILFHISVVWGKSFILPGDFPTLHNKEAMLCF